MQSPPSFSRDILARLDKNGPRYTSYPTADRYQAGFGPAQYRDALAGRARRSADEKAGPLSLYLHIPFCQSLCYYCACNKVITRHPERAARYLDALEREMALHAALLGHREPISQLHLGGGTPTFLDDAELERLMAALRGHFRLLPDAEISIEIDPRTASTQRLLHLARLGFNRLSFGVQDFDPDVQRAVHRIQPYESVRDLVLDAREIGFASVNMDLIYGLPLQTLDSFARTIDQVCGLRPDRIALYGYAHLPDRFKPQRRIVSADLPSGETRIGLLDAAISRFLAAGYDYIGMDHFALHDDALARAKRAGTLHRNFQGYSTQPDCELIALGVSAIGRVGDTYSQNAKTLDDYYARIEQGEFAIERGLAMSLDDLLRREVIMAIMCQGGLDFSSIERAHGIVFESYFATELESLQGLAGMGLVQQSAGRFQVTGTGWYFVRAVAMVFDRHLRERRTQAQYSRIV
ncbi:oxygen-independent coproporphyrinogen III oxidase [Bordetella petrii]|uniref:oxygen-independent coproporphyrinogen III oxidase n=1 Tax=Bordetella petrii TaxID=94624 RepID=UPI001E2D2E7E|nr:oxygen-independent coproporphyrinogen III oxidase [Bordetella petrii]MCD0502035.1 oxygen-independent coproporphyrinogen III oxidase [Bordetella petrii]